LNLFIADTDNNAIRRINLATKLVTTYTAGVAGNEEENVSLDLYFNILWKDQNFLFSYLLITLLDSTVLRTIKSLS
jgi:hypothetical protein